jgi:hypothetical protein
MNKIVGWFHCYWVGYRTAGTPSVGKIIIVIREFYNGGFFQD